MRTVLITGSSGLIGSACVRHYAARGWNVYGFDGNQRAEFFGKDGDTSETLARLTQQVENFRPRAGDIYNWKDVNAIVCTAYPDVVIHCAAQPSHDYATAHPRVDFETNVVGTFNMLEATRQFAPKATFIFASTNKVYGDAPNRLGILEDWQCHGDKGLREFPTRYDVEDENWRGFDETLTIDQSRHSIFGASKAAADLLTQEFGRTFGMRTACFRLGCVTGGAHAGAEQHGFLAYLVRCAREKRPYTIFGYKGKQVRDNLHADDVASAFAMFAENPKVAAVYNLGGGRANSISILEAMERVYEVSGGWVMRQWKYVDEPRGGDHLVYYTDYSKFRTDYPEWSVTKSLDDIFSELTLTPQTHPLRFGM